MNPLVGFLIRLLEVLFVVGWIGSVLVILMSGFETAEAVIEADPLAPVAEPTLPPTSEHL